MNIVTSACAYSFFFDSISSIRAKRVSSLCKRDSFSSRLKTPPPPPPVFSVLPANTGRFSKKLVFAPVGVIGFQTLLIAGIGKVWAPVAFSNPPFEKELWKSAPSTVYPVLSASDELKSAIPSTPFPKYEGIGSPYWVWEKSGSCAGDSAARGSVRRDFCPITSSTRCPTRLFASSRSASSWGVVILGSYSRFLASWAAHPSRSCLSWNPSRPSILSVGGNGRCAWRSGSRSE